MDQFTVSRHLVHSRNRPMHQPFTTHQRTKLHTWLHVYVHTSSTATQLRLKLRERSCLV